MIRLLICLAVVSSTAISSSDIPDLNSGSKPELRHFPERPDKSDPSLSDNESVSRRYELSTGSDLNSTLPEHSNNLNCIELRISDICDSDDVVSPAPPPTVFHSAKR